MYNDRQIKKGGLPVQRKKAMLAAKSHSVEDAPLLKQVILSSLIGAGVIIGTGLLLLFITCFIASSSADPLPLIAPLSLLALFPSNFLGGFISSKRTESSPLVCGIVMAAMWGAVSLILSLCMLNTPSAGYTLWQSILLHAASAFFCILGAFAGKYRPKKDMRKKRKFGR